MYPHSPKTILRDTGAALITALFIMTLVAIAATAMSLRFQIDVRRTQLVLNADNAYLASQAVEFWAISTLKQAAASTNPQQSTQLEYLPLVFPANELPYPSITVTGQLDDLQARFNLNNLMQKGEIPRLGQLLHSVEPNLKPAQALAIATAVANWLSPYSANMTQSEDDLYYQQQHPPYQKSHYPMVSLSEFRLIEGVSADLYQKVAPYICALPKPTPININTAAAPVLQTLGAGLTPAQAQTIINNRGKTGFNSIIDIVSNPELRALEIPTSQVTVASSYFLSTAIASINTQKLIIYTSLERALVNNHVTVTVLNQSINTP